MPGFEPVYFDLVDGYLQTDHGSDGDPVLRGCRAALAWSLKSATPLASSSPPRSCGDAITSFERAVRRRSQPSAVA